MKNQFMTHPPRSRSMHFFGFAFFLLLSITATSLSAAPGTSNLATFSELSELKELADPTVALQMGDSGGIWIKKLGPRSDNGGTIVEVDEAYHWARQCDPGRLDARWFGVVADGLTDDAAALQAAIDALPPSGGKILLPSGTMRCGTSLVINRSFVTIEGTNCGLLSKHFEPPNVIGKGSILFFDSSDGIFIQPPPHESGKQKPARLGGITLREFGIAGTGKQDGQTGIIVKRGENWGWGSTDSLLLQRIYCIDLSWAAKLQEADMSVIDASWLSECGNGVQLDGCIYNIISNTCFADNDGSGVVINGGRGTEISGSVFCRNKHGLTINKAHQIRVIGGIFGTDGAGGKRDDKELIYSSESREVIVQGTSFSSDAENSIPTAVLYQGPKPLVEGCTYSGNHSIIRRTDRMEPDALLPQAGVRSGVALSLADEVVLPAGAAAIRGGQARYGASEDCVGNWDGLGTSLRWEVKMEKPGQFKVALTQARGIEGQAGFEVRIGDRILKGQSVPTGNWTDFKTVELGTITIDKTGIASIEIWPTDESSGKMNFRSMSLTRIP